VTLPPSENNTLVVGEATADRIQQRSWDTAY